MGYYVTSYLCHVVRSWRLQPQNERCQLIKEHMSPGEITEHFQSLQFCDWTCRWFYNDFRRGISQTALLTLFSRALSRVLVWHGQRVWNNFIFLTFLWGTAQKTRKLIDIVWSCQDEQWNDVLINRVFRTFYVFGSIQWRGNHFDVIAILIIWRQEYRKDKKESKETMALSSKYEWMNEWKFIYSA